MLQVALMQLDALLTSMKMAVAAVLVRARDAKEQSNLQFRSTLLVKQGGAFNQIMKL